MNLNKPAVSNEALPAKRYSMAGKPAKKKRGKQADQMSVLRFNMASKIIVLNNFVGSVNSVCLVRNENI
jgi:hypothetical protein